MFFRVGQYQLVGVAGEHQLIVAARDRDGRDPRVGDVDDIALQPLTGVVIHLQGALGQPGLVLTGAAHVDLFVQVALRAGAAVTGDHLDDRFAVRVQHP